MSVFSSVVDVARGRVLRVRQHVEGCAGGGRPKRPRVPQNYDEKMRSPNFKQGAIHIQNPKNNSKSNKVKTN